MKTIDIDHININDKRFCISYPMYDNTLLSSIKKVGIIQPVILLSTMPYVVITGFKRILSAMQAGFTKIPSVIVNISEKDALLYAIHDNIKRGLNIVEKAHGIERMLHMGFSLTEIHEAMMLLSLDPHEKIMERLTAIADMEDIFKAFITTKGVAMKQVEMMMRFNNEERACIIDILTSIHTTESFIREILEMLNIVKIKRGNVDFDSLKNAPDAQELKKILKKLTNPILVSLEEELKQIKLRCALPPDIDIKVDPFFEKGYIDMVIRAKTEDKAKDAIERLNSILSRGYIRSILELTRG
ncbi:MAG: ParB N-terminal domain-containing protein [Proteobacteria bacterium]|nr:ParB N-terminal domain-containing protein [Pseudomonadota bacterium]